MLETALDSCPLLATIIVLIIDLRASGNVEDRIEHGENQSSLVIVAGFPLLDGSSPLVL